MRPEKKGRFDYVSEENQFDDIDTGLGKGIDVELKDIHFGTGLLSYKGRQVLLYIKDHGHNVLAAIENPEEKGRKFHVADCQTLSEMRAKGRFERYVATNETSGDFLIAGQDANNGSKVEQKAKLKVCKYCLGKLNYKGYMSGNYHNKKTIFSHFEMATFFATYSSFFSHMPQRNAKEAIEGYSEDWNLISSKYRLKQDYNCEQCMVNMRAHKVHLHTHHINGVKSDNGEGNLHALCVDCHSKQPGHSHMHVSHDVRQLISRLRREQGLLHHHVNWSDVFNYVDPALHGLLHHCQKEGTRVPEMAYNIQDERSEIATLELAWPHRRFGVAIAQKDIELANANGWTAISVKQFFDNLEKAISLR